MEIDEIKSKMENQKYPLSHNQRLILYLMEKIMELEKRVLELEK